MTRKKILAGRRLLPPRTREVDCARPGGGAGLVVETIVPLESFERLSAAVGRRPSMLGVS
ncbi:uncharacterized protein SOCE26_063260 [Sorangium cellulosum]|uniref:Uncharacterized protein n=1 Tax=Sorangium cellulosum TaxID=56 RepID=A0A2L0F000_SORCE|nr:uncharacterized protein SOCE26_063260 [Sorangium cellulosum]